MTLQRQLTAVPAVCAQCTCSPFQSKTIIVFIWHLAEKFTCLLWQGDNSPIKWTALCCKRLNWHCAMFLDTIHKQLNTNEPHRVPFLVATIVCFHLIFSISLTAACDTHFNYVSSHKDVRKKMQSPLASLKLKKTYAF